VHSALSDRLWDEIPMHVLIRVKGDLSEIILLQLQTWLWVGKARPVWYLQEKWVKKKCSQNPNREEIDTLFHSMVANLLCPFRHLGEQNKGTCMSSWAC